MPPAARAAVSASPTLWKTASEVGLKWLEKIGIVRILPSKQVLINHGTVGVPVIFLLTIFIHIALPAFSVSGYCADPKTRQPIQYRINGILVIVAVLQVFILFALKNTVATVFYDEYYLGASIACGLGLFFSIIAFFRGGEEKYTRCVTVDMVNEGEEPPIDEKKANFLQKFFNGQVWNGGKFEVDYKVLLYLLGAVMLEVNVVSALRAHFLYHQGSILNGMLVYCICMTWFVLDYSIFEYMHLFTYDFFAEKLGFKLIWGCLCFYPFFYPVGIFPLVKARRRDDINLKQSLAIVGLYFIGWIITRGANLQKYTFRKNPESTAWFFGLIPQKTIPGTRLLVSGFWGAARHFNYLGEIIQAIALAIPGYYAGKDNLSRALPWLYPLYYILLFIFRQRDDDKLCSEKYKEKWEEYKKAVPSKIIPGIY